MTLTQEYFLGKKDLMTKKGWEMFTIVKYVNQELRRSDRRAAMCVEKYILQS